MVAYFCDSIELSICLGEVFSRCTVLFPSLNRDTFPGVGSLTLLPHHVRILPQAPLPQYRALCFDNYCFD
jgi:hypothetical protein